MDLALKKAEFIAKALKRIADLNVQILHNSRGSREIERLQSIVRELYGGIEVVQNHDKYADLSDEEVEFVIDTLTELGEIDFYPTVITPNLQILLGKVTSLGGSPGFPIDAKDDDIIAYDCSGNKKTLQQVLDSLCANKVDIDIFNDLDIRVEEIENGLTEESDTLQSVTERGPITDQSVTFQNTVTVEALTTTQGLYSTEDITSEKAVRGEDFFITGLNAGLPTSLVGIDSADHIVKILPQDVIGLGSGLSWNADGKTIEVDLAVDTPNLQQVTEQGNETTRPVIFNGGGIQVVNSSVVAQDYFFQSLNAGGVDELLGVDSSKQIVIMQPSDVIVAGNGLEWSGKTLNIEAAITEKLDSIEEGAQVNDTAEEIKNKYITNNKAWTDSLYDQFINLLNGGNEADTLQTVTERGGETDEEVFFNNTVEINNILTVNADAEINGDLTVSTALTVETIFFESLNGFGGLMGLGVNSGNQVVMILPADIIIAGTGLSWEADGKTLTYTGGGGGGATPNLQQVTTVGGDTTKPITITGASLTVINGDMSATDYFFQSLNNGESTKFLGVNSGRQMITVAPSDIIVAGTDLEWSGNTLNYTGVGGSINIGDNNFLQKVFGGDLVNSVISDDGITAQISGNIRFTSDTLEFQHPTGERAIAFSTVSDMIRFYDQSETEIARVTTDLFRVLQLFQVDDIAEFNDDVLIDGGNFTADGPTFDADYSQFFLRGNVDILEGSLDIAYNASAKHIRLLDSSDIPRGEIYLDVDDDMHINSVGSNLFIDASDVVIDSSLQVNQRTIVTPVKMAVWDASGVLGEADLPSGGTPVSGTDGTIPVFDSGEAGGLADSSIRQLNATEVIVSNHLNYSRAKLQDIQFYGSFGGGGVGGSSLASIDVATTGGVISALEISTVSGQGIRLIMDGVVILDLGIGGLLPTSASGNRIWRDTANGNVLKQG